MIVVSREASWIRIDAATRVELGPTSGAARTLEETPLPIDEGLDVTTQYEEQVEASAEPLQGARDAAERLQRLLEHFSLAPSEVKLLLSLLSLGSGTAKQLAVLTGISRPNVYPSLETLEAKGLVEKMPGVSAAWASLEADELIRRLGQAEEERFAARQNWLKDIRTTLQELPALRQRPASFCRFMDEVSAQVIYQKSMAAVEHEILVFNRGPFLGEMGPAVEVLDALVRGVAARALWQASDLAIPEGEETLSLARDYSLAGVEQRVVDELPISLAVLDKRVALISVPDDDPARGMYPLTFVAENRALALTMAAAFDQLWQNASACDYSHVTRDPHPLIATVRQVLAESENGAETSLGSTPPAGAPMAEPL